MLYPDTVESEVLVHKPWFVSALLVCVLLMFLACNLTGTALGQLMQPVIGDPLESGIYGRLAISFALATVFCVNVVLIGFLPIKGQIVAVWIELAFLFLAFFGTFHLSLPFIWGKLP